MTGFLRVGQNRVVNRVYVVRAFWEGVAEGQGDLVIKVLEPEDRGEVGTYTLAGALADVAWQELTTSHLDMVQAFIPAVVPLLNEAVGAMLTIAEHSGATVLLHEDLLEVARQLKEINLSIADVVAR